MRLKNSNYEIKIEEDATYSINSTDNKAYDIILNPFELKRSDYFSSFSISVNNGIEITTYILIGHNAAYCFSCAVLEDNQLSILMRDDLIQLDLSKHKINKVIHINSFWSVLYEIREYTDGFIIFGELDVIKLNHDFEIEWDFSAPDVINEYSINDNNEILIACWDEKHIKLNSNGEII